MFREVAKALVPKKGRNLISSKPLSLRNVRTAIMAALLGVLVLGTGIDTPQSPSVLEGSVHGPVTGPVELVFNPGANGGHEAEKYGRLKDVLADPGLQEVTATTVNSKALDSISSLGGALNDPDGLSQQRNPRNPISFLTAPSPGDPLDIALDYIHQNKKSMGLTDDDLAGLMGKNRYLSKHNGVTHIYLRQRLGGIEVFNGDININISADGSVINLGNGFVSGLKDSVKISAPSVTAIKAVEQAAQHLTVPITEPLTALQLARGVAQETVLSNGGISKGDIPIKLMYQPLGVGVVQPGRKGEVRLVWDMVIDQVNSDYWWDLRVDAITGEVLSKNDWTAHDNYEVFALPKEYPDDGVRTVAINPAVSTASPFGWHDTNGVSGPEFTITRGNNVHAYADRDNDNSPDTGGEPDGGTTLDFTGSLVSLDLSQDPSTYTAAAVVNLFYWNNIIHDVFYLYGFDEAAGNFQVNNRGNGGLSGDDVRAEAQDGADTGRINNANFSTPPDGSRPRMQMFLWDATTPLRDGDFSNNIIVHEYAHGISTRLTGGPSNVNCLSNAEEMGEGWSDFFGLVLTADSSEKATTSRGTGTYVLGEQTPGDGLRPTPYTTDMSVNPTTYGDIAGLAVPHGVGYAWASILWEVYWNLVAEHGFDSNIFGAHHTGGNNLALQLVVDGLKLQPCSPGFVDGRDAILLADQALTGGANQCTLWEAFAKRGLGASAAQGSSSSSVDGTEAFDLTSSCKLGITQSSNPAQAISGEVLTFTLTVTNNSGDARTGVTITNTVPTDTIFVPGSASDGGSESGGQVSFPPVAMNPGDVIIRTFQVTVNANVPSSQTFFKDTMEDGSGSWTVVGSGAANWVLGTTTPHSPTHVWFADDISTISDQRLEMTNAVVIGANAVLSFWHNYNTEAMFDGGVVEISVNGGSWTDLGSQITPTRYNHTISTFWGNPLAGRNAFAGDSAAYIQTLVDLSSFGGENIQVRFRLGTDISVSDEGWYVDDVEITRESVISNTACVDANEVSADCITLRPDVTVVCTPPGTDEDWIVATTCILEGNATALRNVIVQAGIVLTIDTGVALNIDFSNFHLLINNNAKVVIKSDGKIH